jgi:beta-galactosidase GanA
MQKIKLVTFSPSYFRKISYLIIIFFFFIYALKSSGQQIPFLQKSGNVTQLIVDGKPFIILGGELGNSSASTIDNMQTIWPKLKTLNLNTVLIPVYWELIEPIENKFDFTLLQKIITDAHINNMKIIFLWFGAWKNSMSCYVPEWIKKDPTRFPRIKDNKNKSHEILTVFSENNFKADLKAFENLMYFIKEFDKNNTVLMI